MMGIKRVITRRLNRLRRVGLAALLIVFLPGCAINGIATYRLGEAPWELYPQYPQQKKTSVEIMMDIAVAHDVAGVVDLIDVPECLEMGGALLDELRTGLVRKGYQIEHSTISSIGLSWPTETRCKLVTNETEDLLPVVPPFYLAEDLTEDAEREEEVAELFRELSRVKKRESGKNAMVSSGASREERDSNLMVIMVRARDVPRGKRIAQGAGTGLVVGVNIVSSLAKLVAGIGTGVFSPEALLLNFPEWEESFIEMDLFVIDHETSEVIWSDRRWVEGGQANQRSIDKLARAMIEDIP